MGPFCFKFFFLFRRAAISLLTCIYERGYHRSFFLLLNNQAVSSSSQLRGDISAHSFILPLHPPLLSSNSFHLCQLINFRLSPFFSPLPQHTQHPHTPAHTSSFPSFLFLSFFSLYLSFFLPFRLQLTSSPSLPSPTPQHPLLTAPPSPPSSFFLSVFSFFPPSLLSFHPVSLSPSPFFLHHQRTPLHMPSALLLLFLLSFLHFPPFPLLLFLISSFFLEPTYTCISLTPSRPSSSSSSSSSLFSFFSCPFLFLVCHATVSLRTPCITCAITCTTHLLLSSSSSFSPSSPSPPCPSHTLTTRPTTPVEYLVYGKKNELGYLCSYMQASGDIAARRHKKKK